MPFEKFHSIEEMDKARRDLWCEKLDSQCFKRIARLWERSSRLSPRKYPRGIFKYRSIEEAQAHRELLITENVRRLRAEREP